MILRQRIWSAVAVALLGATVVAHVSHAADVPPKAPLKVYSQGELPLSNYSIIKRLWINMPESAFYVLTQPDSGMAISALVDEATRIGADGVVNLYCLKGGQITAQSSGWYCYGNAIKMK